MNSARPLSRNGASLASSGGADRLSARLHARHRRSAPAVPCFRGRKAVRLLMRSAAEVDALFQIDRPAERRFVKRRIARRDALHADCGVMMTVGAGFAGAPALACHNASPSRTASMPGLLVSSSCMALVVGRHVGVAGAPFGRRNFGAGGRSAAEDESSMASRQRQPARRTGSFDRDVGGGRRREAVVAGPMERDRAALGRDGVERDERVGGNRRMQRGAKISSPL